MQGCGYDKIRVRVSVKVTFKIRESIILNATKNPNP